MNKIEKISKTILKKLHAAQSTKPTVSIIYDSIIEVYPKLNKKDTAMYECHRAIIIKTITKYYDNKLISELDTIKIILSQMIQECDKNSKS